MKRLLILAIVLFIGVGAFVHYYDSRKKHEAPQLVNSSIHRDTEFGGAYIDISIDGFNKLGFAFGDSVDLTFITGAKTNSFEDIGYFSGYYVPAGQMLVVGYKGYDCIKFCINYGDDVYVDNGFNESTACTILLHEAGKYADVESIMSISYSDDRTQYTSDERFANFREVTVGRIAPGVLYRGASPVDDSRKRSSIVDSLLWKNMIVHVIDLADKESSVKAGGKYVVHNYFGQLMDKGRVTFLGMGAAYTSDDFSAKMKDLMLSIMEHPGPHYIHCLEGKDRTGFVCMVLEALCGATRDEMIDDYFVTYANYYGIEKGSEKYNLIKEMHIDEMIRYVESFEGGVNGYLLNIGLTREQIDSIRAKFETECFEKIDPKDIHLHGCPARVNRLP